MLYLTPERFRTMGTGSDLSGIEDWELRSILESSSRLADSYCNAPVQPQPYSFRGGTVTNEPHTFGTDTRRFFFNFRPVRTINSFKMFASNSVFLTIAPNQIYLQEQQGWGEIVATQISLAGSLFPLTPFWGLQYPVARVGYDYGWRLAVTGEFFDPTDARLYRGVNQFWVSTEDVNVYVNGTLADPIDYVVDYEEGTVLFNDALAAEDVVTADYTYPMPFDIARATALIASGVLAERDIVAKGMSQLQSLSVEEVRLTRMLPSSRSRFGVMAVTEDIPDQAKTILNGYRFITVR